MFKEVEEDVLHYGIYILILSCIGVTTIILILINSDTTYCDSRNKHEIKKLVNMLKLSKTLYMTHCGFVDPCFKEIEGWHRTTGHAMLYVKKEGILFKPFISRKFGLLFEDIICIDILEQNQVYAFPMRITIYSIGTKKIILQSERNYLLIDALKRVYNGEIRQLD